MEESKRINTSNWKRLGVPLLIVFLVILADQLFKFWVKFNMTDEPFIPVLGDWFNLNYTENPGMAFGLEIPGSYGKLFLTVFRIVFVVLGLFYLVKQSKSKVNQGFLTCVALIIAGALGNIIDSVFYGVWFADMNQYDGGYFYGQVVDMLHFPIISGSYPSWIPKIGGDSFTFFSPVFNIADTAISTGVIAIFVFQKRYFPAQEEISTQEVTPLSSQEEE